MKAEVGQAYRHRGSGVELDVLECSGGWVLLGRTGKYSAPPSPWEWRGKVDQFEREREPAKALSVSAPD